MRCRMTGKRAARMIGCAVFCLMVCGIAFENRTLVLEPVEALLQGEISFAEMTDTIRRNDLGDRFRGKNELLTLNGGYARLQGRRRYNDTVRMTNGMLASTAASMIDTTAFADNLDRIHRCLEKRGIPFLFVLAPYKVPLTENLLPVGITDMTNAIADQALAELRERNVPVRDLRQEMSLTREQVEKYFYDTDHHWNAEGAFYAFQRIVEMVGEYFPETVMSNTDPARWEKHVLPHWWLGSHGKRVGPLFGGTDDLDYYLPAFETEMTRYSLGVWAEKGDFRKVCIREWFLEHSDFFRLDNYQRYLGGGYPLTLHRNPGAENQRKLLMIRDSYLLPVECFLSTEFTAIDVLDSREYGVMSEMDYATLNPPDMVIMMIYPGIFPSEYYQYFTDFGEEKTLQVLDEIALEDLAVPAASGSPDYATLPVQLAGGKSYLLALDSIQVESGDPDGANIALYDGETLVDQTIFDIRYGNEFEFRWGFQVPGDAENQHDYHLRLYAGVAGGTEGTTLEYRGIRLQEGRLISQ